MYCSECGAKINETDKFCRNCGAKKNIKKEKKSEIEPTKLKATVSYEMEYDLSKNKQKTKKMKTGFLILWIIFFFPVGLFVMWRQKRFTKPVRIIIYAFYGFITIMVLIVQQFAAFITVDSTASYSIEYRDNEPDYKEYFSITAYGDSITVTDSMITENVDTTIIGEYTVSISYITDRDEELNESITIKVVQNKLYIDDTTVQIFVNEDELQTDFDLDSVTPDWTKYFRLRAYGDEIIITTEMITSNLDFSKVSSGEVIISYDDGENIYSESILINVTVNKNVEKLMNIGLTTQESFKIFDYLQEVGIEEINTITPKIGESIDTLKSFEINVNDGLSLLMTVENRELYYLGAFSVTLYDNEDGVQGHTDDFIVEEESYYITKIESFGFVNYNDNFVWESTASGKSIMFQGYSGSSSIAFEYESYQDGTLWSYYPNLDIGYIDSPSMSDACEYDLVSNSFTSTTTCSQTDLDILFLLISVYEQTLNDLGTTSTELNETIEKLLLSRNLNK